MGQATGVLPAWIVGFVDVPERSRDVVTLCFGSACRRRGGRSEATHRHSDVDATPFEHRVLRHEAQCADLHV